MSSGDVLGRFVVTRRLCDATTISYEARAARWGISWCIVWMYGSVWVCGYMGVMDVEGCVGVWVCAACVLYCVVTLKLNFCIF